MGTQIPGGFAGLSILQDMAHFSRYYQVERDGFIERTKTADFEQFSSDCESTEQIIQLAGQFGLASGKIFIPLLNRKNITLSGFWVGPIFITCAHFYPKYYDVNSQQQLKDLLMQGDLQLVVSSRVNSKEIDPSDIKVQLVEASSASDLALFRAVNSLQTPPHALRTDQLYALGEHDFFDNLEFLPAFTVNYCGHDGEFSVEELEEYENFIATSGFLPARDGPLAKFSLLRRRLLNAPTHEGDSVQQLLLNKSQEAYPTFQEIYEPDRRAIAVGRLLNPGLKESSWRACSHQKISSLPAEPVTITMRHTISGFYGCSGGMICWFKDNDINHPVVVGILAKVVSQKVAFEQLTDQISGLQVFAHSN
ncbi:MAG: hypothetical protein M1836_008150 [Candelina mexicana]|nr:MAG: hypothetical protein M1836_008150 [Candelina mexicana]